MAGGTGRRELGPGDELYPPALARRMPRPPRLHVVGDAGSLLGPCISVVGARRATPYGLAVAEMAGRVAAECGLVVVSGGAVGCDHAAARAALDAGGSTVVVAGCGADRVYPASSSDVFSEAASGRGCVVSVERWGAPPARHTFPRRNVVIAALSDCLLVAEAGARSGTMSTAEAAREMGCCVMAAPGSIFSPTSSGTNRLIADGAQALCDERDLELAISLSYNVGRLVGEHERPDLGDVMSALVAQPMRPQELAERTNRGVLELLRVLTDYESCGLVERLPDGRYAASRKALLGKGRI